MPDRLQRHYRRVREKAMNALQRLARKLFRRQRPVIRAGMLYDRQERADGTVKHYASYDKGRTWVEIQPTQGDDLSRFRIGDD